MRRGVIAFGLAVLTVGCSPGRDASGPGPVPLPTTGASSRFAVPAAISRAVPPAPPSTTPADPSSVRRTQAAHAAFFAGEVAVGNGVFYLALPGGSPFGYYSYLANANYIYDFDSGYEFVDDANDAQGGVYFYDFASAHWWYTSRAYPFPYLYDFSLGTVLYYFPDPTNAGRYTSNPRYFYDFATQQTIVMPAAPVVSPTSLSFTAAGSDAALPFAASESGYSGSFTVATTACSGIVTVAAASAPNSFTVTPQAAGTCNLSVKDAAQRTTTLPVSVTTTSLIGQ